MYRNASVRTLKPCELLVLDKEKFAAIAKDHPAFSNEVTEVAMKRRKPVNPRV